MQHALTARTEGNQAAMVSPLKSTLLHLYPEKEGWKLYNRFNWSTRVFDYVLQKEESGIVYRILVELNLEAKVTKDHFVKLDSLANRLEATKGALTRKIMIVDDAANMEYQHSDTEVIYLSSLFNTSLLTGGFDKTKLVA